LSTLADHPAPIACRAINGPAFGNSLLPEGNGTRALPANNALQQGSIEFQAKTVVDKSDPSNLENSLEATGFWK
jgi:hypothetical protein